MADTNKKLKKTQKASRRQKATIIGLSIALALAGGAAVAAPLIVMNKNKTTGGGGGGDTKFHTVTFDTDGGSTIPAVQIKDGQTIESIAKPTKKDYVFIGWYYEGTQGTTLWNMSDPVKSDLNLKAHWNYSPEVVVKTITYIGNGGTFGEEPQITQSIVQGKAFGSTAPDMMPTQDNMAFTGWYTGPKDTDAKVENSTIVNDNMTVYAHWISQVQHSTIQFMTSEGEQLVGKSSIQVEKTDTWEEIGKQQPFVKKTGYTFDHWSLDKSDTSKIISESQVFETNTCLYPHFEQNPTPAEVCHIHFNAEGGTVVGSDALTVDIGENPTWGSIPKPEVQKEGCFLSGWVDSEGNTLEDDTTLPRHVGETEKLEVYAVFDTKINAPIITFEAPDQEVEYMWVGNTVFRAQASEEGTSWSSVPKPKVYKAATGSWHAGYTSDWYFTGWKAKINGELVDVPDPITQAEITIVPQFAEKTEIIFLDKDGGELDRVKVADTDKWNEIVKPEAPEVTDFYFSYWTAANKETGEYERISDTSLMSTYDLTKPIKPVYIEAASACLLTFSDVPVYESGAEFTGTFEGYWGNPIVAIPVDGTTTWNQFNKPALITKDEFGNPVSYAFIRWEINLGTEADPDWTIIDDTSRVKITGRSDGYDVRPVIEDKFTVTFDAGEGSIEGAVTSITASSSTKFEDLPKPTVTPPEDPETSIPYIFKYWAEDEAGNYPVSNGKTFTQNTTLYAIYDKPTVSTTVNYKLTDAQKEAGATITSGSTIVLNHPKTSTITFGQVGKATIDYPGYVVSYWTTDPDNPEQGKLTSSSELVNGDNNIYPVFDVNDIYRKVTVKKGDWTIKSGDTLFIKPGNVILSEITTEVEYKGRELLGWKIDGKEDLLTVTDKMPDQNDLVLVPVFGDPCMKRIKITNNGNTLIRMTSKEFDTEYGTKVLDLVADQVGESAPVWEGSTFVEWQILNADGTTKSISNDMLVESDLTLVPKFTGESEFLETNLAYFFDDREGKKAWAGIVDYTGANLTIRYGGDSTLYTFPKSEFNYQIHFGRDFKEIPDYFMMGCVKWDNAGEKLTFPSGIKSIGKCFLKGCATFNQEIDLSGCVTGKEFHIGEQFMAQCYKYNHDLDLSHCGGYQTGDDPYSYLYIDGCGAFMFDCQSFTGMVTFPCHSAQSYKHVNWASQTTPGAYTTTPDKYSLASSIKYAPLVYDGEHSTTGFDTNLLEDDWSIVEKGPWRKIRPGK